MEENEIETKSSAPMQLEKQTELPQSNSAVSKPKRKFLKIFLIMVVIVGIYVAYDKYSSRVTIHNIDYSNYKDSDGSFENDVIYFKYSEKFKIETHNVGVGLIYLRVDSCAGPLIEIFLPSLYNNTFLSKKINGFEDYYQYHLEDNKSVYSRSVSKYKTNNQNWIVREGFNESMNLNTKAYYFLYNEDSELIFISRTCEEGVTEIDELMKSVKVK